ncbi:MAG: polymer-forming cytoskeletal protein [Candidatus Neomarinimicrobiota bacterium]
MDKIDFKDVHSMIGAEMRIDGNVILKSGLIVYGRIYGDITTDGPVRIASSGEVVGNIIASDIHISGRVRGDVTVRNRAVLGENSVLVGDLVYRSLLIEEGSQFEGKCDLIGNGTVNGTDAEPVLFPEGEQTD